MSRRTLITGAAAVAAAPMLPRHSTNLFRLGVASGDPLPTGVALWTRLAPRPTDGGGMPDRAVPVDWEVADDERFRRVRRSGVAVAHPASGHAVHVDVHGLRPDHAYFYRFRAGRQISPVGRTRTAPDPRARPRHLRFAFASCQDYQSGFYTAYRHLAREDVAFVAFLGDYIYETGRNPLGVRLHETGREPYTLTDYRNRYATYKSDPDLRAAHAAAPWIVTLDDHEIDNDWAGGVPQDPDLQSYAAFRARRAAALRAFYEHMPLRLAARPRGLDMRVYRRMRFGTLASLHVLDTRQHRSDQPITLAQANAPGRTMTGATQERWLRHGLLESDTTWNLLANQVMWAQNLRPGAPGGPYVFASWDGYRAQRRRLLALFGSRRVRNPVVLSGDRHSTFVCDLRPNFDDPRTPVVAAEITGTSITSGGDPDRIRFHQTNQPLLSDNPHWRYLDSRRGYVLCDVHRTRMVSRLRVVETVRERTSRIRTAAAFAVEAGRPGIASVST